MDKSATRAAFEHALETSRPEFGEFFLAKLLGLEIEYGDKQCRVAFEVKDFMRNPQGTLHGGIIATVMDISMGHLLKHVQGAGTTLEMKTQYVKAAASGKLLCTGEFIKQGNGISYLRSTLADESGDCVAFATATWKRLKSAGAS
jgi:uncharacterized protein (TIGR00369 family)